METEQKQDVIGYYIKLRSCADAQEFENDLTSEDRDGTFSLFKQSGSEGRYVWLAFVPAGADRQVNRAGQPFHLQGLRGRLEKIEERFGDVCLAFSAAGQSSEALFAEWNERLRPYKPL